MSQTPDTDAFFSALERVISMELEAERAGWTVDRAAIRAEREELMALFPAAACEAVAGRLYEATGPETSAADRAILTVVIGALRGPGTRAGTVE